MDYSDRINSIAQESERSCRGDYWALGGQIKLCLPTPTQPLSFKFNPLPSRTDRPTQRLSAVMVSNCLSSKTKARARTTTIKRVLRWIFHDGKIVPRTIRFSSVYVLYPVVVVLWWINVLAGRGHARWMVSHSFTPGVWENAVRLMYRKEWNSSTGTNEQGWCDKVLYQLMAYLTGSFVFQRKGRRGQTTTLKPHFIIILWVSCVVDFGDAR